MRSTSRREFLHDSSAMLAAAAAATGVFGGSAKADEAKSEKKADSGDRLNVAVIGVNGRGKAHIGGFAGKHNCIITTICDADEAVVGSAIKSTTKAQGGIAPKYEKDLRRVFDDKSIHIVSIATPNHWHALAAIWALQAGKDVYVEKPVSHNVLEGRRIVEAARKYNRICQTGTQCRSMAGTIEAMAYLHTGKLGKVKLARGLCYKPRGSIGKADGPQVIPASVDYDLWCGPAPMKPLTRKKLHYDWHWTWDYGNGDLGNQGIHQMDVGRWGLGKKGLAKSCISFGGRFGYIDDGETANTQVCVFDYGDCELIFEVRGLSTKSLLGASVGNIFYGSEGYMVCPGYDSAVVYSPKGEVIKKFKASGDHFGNFVDAVRIRKPEVLNADIEEGHYSSALCHLGNISYRLGTQQPFNKKTNAFGDDKDAMESLSTMEEHLKGASVPLDATSYLLGRKLTIDPQKETIGDKEAAPMLTREYRAPYVVPEKV